MLKDLLSQMTTRVTAGAVGALLVMGGVGAAAGIGPMELITHEESNHECVELDELAENFEENIVVCVVEPEDEEDTTTPVNDDEGDDASHDELAPVEEGDLPPVPTTTSEAAQIHAFDEACGNHGMYVSFFAQMGFEPPCALLARAGAEQDDSMTRQERKKAALQLRKECKARQKAGNPCTAEEFMPSETEPAEEDAATTDASAEAEADVEEDGETTDEAEANDKDKDNKSKDKDNKSKSKGKDAKGKGAKGKGGKGNR